MTSKGPEKAWLHESSHPAERGVEGWWHICEGADGPGLGQYIRKDVSDAAVAAAYEDAARGIHEAITRRIIDARVGVVLQDAIRSHTETDALEAYRRQVRAKALKEAAGAIPLPENGTAGEPQDATDRLLDAQRRMDRDAIFALIGEDEE